MLSYIVPPIIIVASLAILVIFLFKKLSKEGVADSVVLEKMSGSGTQEGLSVRFFRIMSQLWLKILERGMQKMKLFSLRIHNASNDWFHSIKSKREQNGNTPISIFERDKKVGQDVQPENVVEKIVDVEEKTEKVAIGERRFFKIGKPSTDGISETKERFSGRGGMFFRKRKADDAKIDDKPVKRVGMENELIKRIAINPKDIEAYERLGDYYSEISNLRDSMECYKQVLKLSPDNNEARKKMRNLEAVLRK